MDKGNVKVDPRGLIFESYRMDGIVIEECRSIFLDWALGQPNGSDMQAALKDLEAEYVAANPNHPMSLIIKEGLNRSATATGRRRGRARREADRD